MRRSTSRLAAIVGVLGLAAAACTGGTGAASPSTAASAGGGGGGGEIDCEGSGDKGTVNIAVNPWVGYEANVAVVGCLLKEQGFDVEEKTLKEEISWQGFENGDVDVIIENWGHPDLAKTYIDDKKVAVNFGPTGNEGIIGWYVPPWLAKEHPDVLDWNNLNKYADNFKTTESGDKGQLLDGDPSFVTNDEALVTNLNLNFKVVYAGSEAALIEAFRTAEQQKQWVIGYFYEPQWFLSEVPLAHVKLPEYTAGCDADPKKVNCDYPLYTLDKIVSKKFADEGGQAATIVKNFTWTNDDQNSVSKDLNDGVSHDEAGAKWLNANGDKWQAWLGS